MPQKAVPVQQLSVRTLFGKKAVVDLPRLVGNALLLRLENTSSLVALGGRYCSRVVN